MAQKLIFPFKRARIVAGFGTKKYKEYWGYNHWGIDISSRQGYTDKEISVMDHGIYASGTGKVVYCQYDVPKAGGKSLGYALCIVYKDCISHAGEKKDLVARYMHCGTVYVKEGDTVSAGNKIAEEGMVGAQSYHLHLELDTDTANPRYSPQVSRYHTAWICQDDPNYFYMTLNPSLWLWQNENYVQDPYRFDIWTAAWINEEDKELPMIETTNEDLKRRIAELEKEVTKYLAEIDDLNKKIANAKKALS